MYIHICAVLYKSQLLFIYEAYLARSLNNDERDRGTVARVQPVFFNINMPISIDAAGAGGTRAYLASHIIHIYSYNQYFSLFYDAYFRVITFSALHNIEGASSCGLLRNSILRSQRIQTQIFLFGADGRLDAFSSR